MFVLEASFEETVTVIDAAFAEDSVVLDASFTDNDHFLTSEIQIDYSGDPLTPYDGPYEATPSTIRQIFATKDKRMIDDFTVQRVPYEEQPLPSGGHAVIIL